jgi:hypothetical protein
MVERRDVEYAVLVTYERGSEGEAVTPDTAATPQPMDTAAVERSVRLDATNWTKARVHRQYPVGSQGQALQTVEERLLRAHGYVPSEHLPMGDIFQVTYESTGFTTDRAGAPPPTREATERSLRLDASDWTRPRVHRQYRNDSEGEHLQQVEGAMLRAHRYRAVDRLEMGSLFMVTYDHEDAPPAPVRTNYEYAEPSPPSPPTTFAPASRGYTNCVYCGRPLTDAVSMAVGAGPLCRARHGW